MGLERELKLDLAPGVALPTLRGAGGVVDERDLPSQSLDAVYWDTPAGGLLAQGATLRRRTGEGRSARWTLKLPAGSTGATDDGTLARDELEVDDDAAEPPAALLDRLADVVAVEDLAPVARLRAERRRRALLDGGGAVVAEVDDDTVTAEVPGRDDRVFREVEVELGPDGGLDVLDAVAQRLRAAGARPADPRPKLARALAPGDGAA